jgi:hypothetical protein
MRRCQHWFWAGWFGLTLALLSASPARPPQVAAQATSWSAPGHVPDYADDDEPPYLIADQDRTVHAFNSEWIDGDLAVTYRRWTQADGWTSPVDVLASDRAGYAQIEGAYLDLGGVAHVVYFGGNEQGASIYYARAPATDADKLTGWSTPQAIAMDAGPLPFAALAGDGNGNLFVVYSGRGHGNGLYTVHSADGGDTWSAPAIVYSTGQAGAWAAKIRLDVDRQGRLHAVWSVVNNAGLGEGVYYARLEADHARWSKPTRLAVKQKGGYEADWASIKALGDGDQLVVIYQDDVWIPQLDQSPAQSQPTRWMRLSADGGQTWSDPARPFPHIGEYGHAALLLDSAGVLHMVLGDRLGDPLHGMWHSVWLGDRWSSLEPIVAGPPSQSFDPTHPQAVISQGNLLLVTWRSDPNSTPNGIWFSYAQLDAPELPVVSVPQPTVSRAAAPAATLTTPGPTPAPSPRAVASPISQSAPFVSTTNDRMTSMLIGDAPAIGLLLIVLGICIVKRVGRP